MWHPMPSFKAEKADARRIFRPLLRPPRVPEWQGPEPSVEYSLLLGLGLWVVDYGLLGSGLVILGYGLWIIGFWVSYFGLLDLGLWVSGFSSELHSQDVLLLVMLVPMPLC